MGKKRREDFTVTYNEDSAEAENSPWQSGHFKGASEGLDTIGDSYLGSQSQIYNHPWKGLILWAGHSLSISALIRLLLLQAEIAALWLLLLPQL